MGGRLEWRETHESFHSKGAKLGRLSMGVRRATAGVRQAVVPLGAPTV